MKRNGDFVQATHDICIDVSISEYCCYDFLCPHLRLEVGKVYSVWEVVGNPDSQVQWTRLDRHSERLACTRRGAVTTQIVENREVAATHLQWLPWEHARPARTLEHQQYFICLRIAEEYRQSQRHCSSDSSDSEDGTCLDEDVLLRTSASDDVLRCTHTFATIPAEVHYVDEDVDTSSDGPSAGYVSRNHTTMEKLLEHSITAAALPEDCTDSFVACADVIDVIGRSESARCFRLPLVATRAGTATKTRLGGNAVAVAIGTEIDRNTD
jgi:hypothetical protein